MTVQLEEMVRTYLKQLLIRATRSWKRQHLTHDVTDHQSDLEFFRKFTRLVEEHYKSKHTVADYADFLCVAPKTITHKFNKLQAAAAERGNQEPDYFGSKTVAGAYIPHGKGNRL
jgi:hypothetical protein